MPETAGVAGRTDGNLADTRLLTEMMVLSWFYHKCITNCSFSFSPVPVSLFCTLFFNLKIMVLFFHSVV